MNSKCRNTSHPRVTTFMAIKHFHDLAEGKITMEQYREADSSTISLCPYCDNIEEPKPDSERRTFPIQDGPSIPWELIVPHDRQCQLNHGGQSVERIAQRGGLSMREALAVLKDTHWKNVQSLPADQVRAEFLEQVGWLSPVQAQESRTAHYEEGRLFGMRVARNRFARLARGMLADNVAKAIEVLSFDGVFEADNAVREIQRNSDVDQMTDEELLQEIKQARKARRGQ